MRRARHIFSVALLLIVAGCASTHPDKLAKASRHEEILLNERISTVSYRGMRVRCEEGALPGTYVAKNEDANGTYYFGADRSVWMTNEMIQPKPRLLVGVIYVPKNPERAPQFFYLFEKETHVVDDINRFVNQRNEQAFIASTVSGAGAGFGANVVGNAIGGALVNAMIDANVGQIEMYPPIEDADVKRKIYAAIRPTQQAH